MTPSAPVAERPAGGGGVCGEENSTQAERSARIGTSGSHGNNRRRKNRLTWSPPESATIPAVCRHPSIPHRVRGYHTKAGSPVDRGDGRLLRCFFARRDPGGRIAQLVEHCPYKAGVAGSSPVPPTKAKTGGYGGNRSPLFLGRSAAYHSARTCKRWHFPNRAGYHR